MSDQVPAPRLGDGCVTKGRASLTLRVVEVAEGGLLQQGQHREAPVLRPADLVALGRQRREDRFLQTRDTAATSSGTCCQSPGTGRPS